MTPTTTKPAGAPVNAIGPMVLLAGTRQRDLRPLVGRVALMVDCNPRPTDPEIRLEFDPQTAPWCRVALCELVPAPLTVTCYQCGHVLAARAARRIDADADVWTCLACEAEREGEDEHV